MDLDSCWHREWLSLKTPIRCYGQFREKLEACSDSDRVFVDQSIPFTYRLIQEILIL